MSDRGDIVFYSIVTAILCGILWSLGDVPWQGLLPIGIILVVLITVSVLKKGKGGPDSEDKPRV